MRIKTRIWTASKKNDRRSITGGNLPALFRAARKNTKKFTCTHVNYGLSAFNFTAKGIFRFPMTGPKSTLP